MVHGPLVLGAWIHWTQVLFGAIKFKGKLEDKTGEEFITEAVVAVAGLRWPMPHVIWGHMKYYTEYS